MPGLKKNDEIEVTIESMSSIGSGVGHYEGMAVFVSGTAVGDRVLAHVIKAKKSYAVAKAFKILKPSESRIQPDCLVSGRCGGCAYRHITYEAECQLKWERVRDALARIGGLDLVPEPIVPAEQITRYRNKAQYPVSIQDENVEFGFYAAHSHRVVPCGDCPLQPEEFKEGLEAFRRWALESGVTGYHETTHKGLLRHIYFRKAFCTGEIMACAVINGNELPKPDLLVTYLRQALPGLKSVVVNRNRDKTNVILGKRTTVIWGSPTITDELLGLRFTLSPHSFYQVNYAQTEKLYAKARAFAGLTGKEIVVDLYCGAGTIGLTMADKAKKIIGIEIVPQAVENARQNAAQNGIENAEFFCMDAAEGAKELRRKAIKPDVVVLDPPRKGCGEDLIHTVAEMAPERVVYVSCDPATLARDLAVFQGLGYTTQKAVPFDLFPRTVHVETVVVLHRKEET